MDRSYAAREDIVVLSHHEHAGPLGHLAPFEVPGDAGLRAMLEQMKEHRGLAA
jgi:hypothetical protein